MTSNHHHLDRKELKKPDTFLEASGSVMDWIRHHRKPVMGAILGLFVVVMGTVAYLEWQDHRGDRAASEFYTARQALGKQLKEFIPADGKAPVAPDWETKVQVELEALAKVIDRNSGTAAAAQAALLLGDTYSSRNNAAKAQTFYEKALKVAPSSTFKAMALHALAYTQESQKQIDAAIQSLTQATAHKDSPVLGDSLLALARLYHSKGDKAKAQEIYARLMKDFPNTSLAKSAEALKNR